ncbi:MAG: hypothetical protein J6S67_20870 [Methanobrevibacter sp.]|nr:hypothetical protein [Methanobrevibacter sp.]
MKMLTNTVNIDRTFSQPVLSSNGTWGSSALSCTANWNNSTAYQAFDGNANTYAGGIDVWGTYNNLVLDICTKNKININSLSMKVSGNTIDIYYSDDNSNWILCFNKTGNFSQATVSCDIGGTGLHNYFRFNTKNTAGTAGSQIYEITLDATEKAENVTKTSAIKDSGNYYVLS